MTFPHPYRKDPDGFWLCCCGLPKSNQVHAGLLEPLDPTESADNWDAQVIDQAIRTVAAKGSPFSANDIRPLLPRVKTSLVGQRFRELIRAQEITPTSEMVPSTDQGTHGHRIAVYTRGPMLRTKVSP